MKHTTDKLSKTLTIAILFVSIGVWFLLTHVIMSLVKPLYPDFFSKKALNFISMTIIPYLIVVPVIYLFIRHLPTGDLNWTQDLAATDFFKLSIIQCGISFPINALLSSLEMRIKGGTHFEADHTMSAIMIFILLIFNPIAEGIFWRRILLNRLRPFGNSSAIFWGDLLFGLPHLIGQGVSGFVYTTLIGTFWAYITVQSNKFFYAMILHSLANLYAAVLPPVILANKSISSIFVVIWFGIMPI
ncbi:MAG TPA: CPBP family intramembrane metalloprotease, partial [Clostridiaceae bacterium]|nr:CPBP family intramembrane metalloprotease [Clostridiaceae bacterium]